VREKNLQAIVEDTQASDKRSRFVPDRIERVESLDSLRKGLVET
jgi:hypothetical protein